MFRTPSKLVKRDLDKEKKADQSTSEDQRSKEPKPPKKERHPSPPRSETKMTTQPDEWNKVPDKLTILTSESYARWRYDIEIILSVRGLWKITTGDEKAPDRPDDLAAVSADIRRIYYKDLNAWLLKDNKAKEILTRSLDSQHHDVIRSCKLASRIWSTLKTLYESNTGTSVLQVTREFHNMKWRLDDSVMGFFGRLRTVANKAEALNAAISSTTIIAKIMSEAPAVYTPLKESWEVTMLSGTKLTLDQLLGQMVRVERQHEQERQADDAHGLHKAFTVKTQQNFRTRNCDNCGKRGHFKAVCWLPGGGAHVNQQAQNRIQREDNGGTAATGAPNRSSATNRSGAEHARAPVHRANIGF